MKYNDPFKKLIDVVKKLYGNLPCVVSFDILKKHHGVCFLSDNGKYLDVRVSAKLPVRHAIEVMAHELAHVVGGPNHGPRWKKVFSRIHKEYMK